MRGRGFGIVAESDDWVVINKPAGLLVHPSKPGQGITLWDSLKELLAYELATGGQISIINRLDRETSGLVLVAKNHATARELHGRMERREMAKEYLAIVRGWPADEAWTVEAPLLRQGDRLPSPIYLKQMVHPEGTPAQTHFSVEQKTMRHEEKLALVRATPITGRMHQIRVHLAHSGFPVVGDKIYGGEEECYLEFIRTGWTEALATRLLLSRHALHSSVLSAAKGLHWEAPLPDDLRDFLV